MYSPDNQLFNCARTSRRRVPLHATLPWPGADEGKDVRPGAIFFY
jgi:hypothetical protein